MTVQDCINSQTDFDFVCAGTYCRMVFRSKNSLDASVFLQKNPDGTFTLETYLMEFTDTQMRVSRKVMNEPVKRILKLKDITGVKPIKK